MVPEIWARIDKAEHFHDLLHAVETAECGFDDGQQAQARKPGVLETCLY